MVGRLDGIVFLSELSILNLYTMKFLSIHCENRKATVYVSLDKIVLITMLEGEEACLIELGESEPVKVKMPAEELVRKINGEDKTAIGFRTGR
jgi:hypothetical protein